MSDVIFKNIAGAKWNDSFDSYFIESNVHGDGGADASLSLGSNEVLAATQNVISTTQNALLTIGIAELLASSNSTTSSVDSTLTIGVIEPLSATIGFTGDVIGFITMGVATDVDSTSLVVSTVDSLLSLGIVEILATTIVNTSITTPALLSAGVSELMTSTPLIQSDVNGLLDLGVFEIMASADGILSNVQDAILWIGAEENLAHTSADVISNAIAEISFGFPEPLSHTIVHTYDEDLYDTAEFSDGGIGYFARSITDSLLTIGIVEVLGSTGSIVSTVSDTVLTLGIVEDLAHTISGSFSVSNTIGDLILGVETELTATVNSEIGIVIGLLTLGIQEATASTGVIISSILNTELTIGVDTDLSHDLYRPEVNDLDTGDLFIECEDSFDDENGVHVPSSVGVVLTTDKAKYGDKSAYFNGSSRLNVADHGDWTIGSSDFTIDMWVNFDDVTITHTLMSHWRSYTLRRGWLFRYIGSSSLLHFNFSTTGDNNITRSVSWSAEENTWYHIALTRESGVLRFFVDGVQIGSDATFTNTIYNTVEPLRIGSYRNSSADHTNYLTGYIDRIRFDEKKALWTENFDIDSPVEMFYNQIEHTVIMNESQVSSFLIIGITETLESSVNLSNVITAGVLFLGDDEILSHSVVRVQDGLFTDDLTGSGTATARQTYSGDTPNDLFDNSSASFWRGGTYNTNWVTYQFPNPEVITKLTLQCTISESRAPNLFTLIASNTGVFGGEEVTLLSVNEGNGYWAYDYEIKEWVFANTDAYEYYRIVMSGKEGAFGSAAEYLLSEIELIGATYTSTYTNSDVNADITMGLIEDLAHSAPADIIQTTINAVAILGWEELLASTEDIVSVVTDSELTLGGIIEPLSSTCNVISYASAVTIVFGVTEILSATCNTTTAVGAPILIGQTEILEHTCWIDDPQEPNVIVVVGQSALTADAYIGNSEILTATDNVGTLVGAILTIGGGVEELAATSEIISTIAIVVLEVGLIENLAATNNIISDTIAGIQFGVNEYMAHTAFDISSDVTASIIMGTTEDLAATIALTTTDESLLDLGVTEVLADVDNALVSNVTGDLTLGGGIEQLAHTLFEFTSGPVDPYIVSNTIGLVDLGVDEYVGTGIYSNSVADATLTIGHIEPLSSTNIIYSDINGDVSLGSGEELSDEAVAWTSISGLLTIGIIEFVSTTSISNSVADAEMYIGGPVVLDHTLTNIPENHPCNFGVLFIDGENLIQDETEVHTVTAEGDASITLLEQTHGNSSIAFDGDGDLLRIDKHTDFNIAKDFTIDMWVKLNDLTDWDRIFIGQYDTENWIQFFIYDSKLVVRLMKDGTLYDGIESNTISADTWYHIGFTNINTTNTMKLYINGTETTSTFTTAQGAIAYFDGYLDMIRWSDEILWTENYNSSNDRELFYECAAIAETPDADLTIGIIEALSHVIYDVSSTATANIAIGVSEIVAGATFSVSVTTADLILGIVEDLSSTQNIEVNVSSILILGVDEPLNHTSTVGNIGETGVLFINGEGIIEDENKTHALTILGNPTISSAYRKDGSSSIYFDGTEDCLIIPDHNDFDFGTGDFTIDFWLIDNSLGLIELICKRDAGGYDEHSFTFNSYATYINSYIGGPDNTLTAYFNPKDGNWHHIALVRSGTNFNLYIDGISKDSFISSAAINTTLYDIRIARNIGSSYLNGYMDNIRIVKGKALWTSNFNTVNDLDYPSLPLVQSSIEIELDLGGMEYIGGANITQSTTYAELTLGISEDLTATCNATIEGGTITGLLTLGIVEILGTTSVFTTNTIAELTLGGGIEQLSATSDNPSSDVSSELQIGGYIEVLAAAAAGAGGDPNNIAQSYVIGSTIIFGVSELLASTGITASTTDADLTLGIETKLSATDNIITSTTAWIGFGVSEELSATIIAQTSGDTEAPVFGVEEVIAHTIVSPLAGPIVESNLTIGVMEMVSVTAGLVSTTSVSLLDLGVSEVMGGTDSIISVVTANLIIGGIEDLSHTLITTVIGDTGNLFIDGEDIIEDENGTHTITNYGNVAISTSKSARGNSSIYFDGSGDYLTIPDSSDFDFNTGDFTIDCWLYVNNSNDRMFMFDTGDDRSAQTNKSCRFVYIGSSNTLQFIYSTNGTNENIVQRSWTATQDIWYHISLVRHGNDLKMYVDGTQQGLTYDINTDSIYNSTRSLAIGAGQRDGNHSGAIYFSKGYLDNFRVTKGDALWTTSFDVDDDDEMFYSYDIINTFLASPAANGDLTLGITEELSATSTTLALVGDGILALGIVEVLGLTASITSDLIVDLTLGVSEPLASTASGITCQSDVDATLVLGGGIEQLAHTMDSPIVTVVEGSTLDTGVIETASAFRMIWSQIHTPDLILGLTEFVSASINIATNVSVSDLIIGLVEVLSSTIFSVVVAEAIELSTGGGEYLDYTETGVTAQSSSIAFLSTGTDELLSSTIIGTGATAGELIFGLIEILAVSEIITSMTIGWMYAGVEEILEGSAPGCHAQSETNAAVLTGFLQLKHTMETTSKGSLFI